jgi:catechol 2,3-dioxygenase-like lactoylglutathione lyase family enzyme
MTSRISHTSFDARNAYAQSVFWSQVLDFVEDSDDPNEPGHEECLIISRDQSQLLLFITVPDDKQVKNRVHLDLRPVDRTREQEVGRLLELGASQLADHRRPDGSGWITMADPEGNEFCILSQNPAGSGSRSRCESTAARSSSLLSSPPATAAVSDRRVSLTSCLRSLAGAVCAGCRWLPGRGCAAGRPAPGLVMVMAGMTARLCRGHRTAWHS